MIQSDFLLFRNKCLELNRFSLHLIFLFSVFLTLTVRSILKRPKFEKSQSNVHFDQVTVFSFPRCQGFISVPSRGGATLGMVRRHSALQRYTVAEYSLEQRHRRKERLRKRQRAERLEALKHKVSSPFSYTLYHPCSSFLILFVMLIPADH